MERIRAIRILPAIVLLFGAVTAGCGSSAPGPSSFLQASTKGIPPGEGRLAGRVGPATPSQGRPSRLTLIFTQGTTKVQSTAMNGVYRLLLPTGRWSVSAVGGGVCVKGIKVEAGAWQREDLIYPNRC